MMILCLQLNQMDKTMDTKQFDILLDFHKGLIRSQPHEKTVTDARNGVDTGAAGNLIDALTSRLDFLKSWTKSATPLTKRNIYNAANTRNPSQGAFDGAFQVIDGGVGTSISKAAKQHGVNYQSIKVLIPRLKRWDSYAKKLHETL